MPQQNGRPKSQRIHILARGSIHLAGLCERRALRLGLAGGIDVGHAHEAEESFAFLVVFFCHADGAPGEFVDFFGGADFLGFVDCGFGFFAFGKAFC
jgi:hypothetical protein